LTVEASESPRAGLKCHQGAPKMPTRLVEETHRGHKKSQKNPRHLCRGVWDFSGIFRGRLKPQGALEQLVRQLYGTLSRRPVV
jgi:hypothetical protein